MRQLSLGKLKYRDIKYLAKKFDLPVTRELFLDKSGTGYKQAERPVEPLKNQSTR